jgi:hypothetical protein
VSVLHFIPLFERSIIYMHSKNFGFQLRISLFGRAPLYKENYDGSQVVTKVIALI